MPLASVLRYLLPQSWFAVLYACLYVLAPFINQFMNALSEKNRKQLLLVCFAVFSIWPWCVDLIEAFTGLAFNGLSTIGMYGSQSGYTIVNFVFMYMIGAYIRRMEKSVSPCKCMAALVGCVMFTFVFGYYLETHGYNPSLAFSYCSPTVILTAVFLFLMFSGFKIQYNPIVSSISKATFSVYLLNSTLIAEFFYAKEYVLGSGYRMLGHIVLTCVVICIFSWIAQVLFDIVTNPIVKWIDAHLPFSTKIGVE